MRVIKHGNRFEKGPVKCFCCLAEIMYCDLDVRDECSLDKERVKGIRCPECNTFIKVKGE